MEGIKIILNADVLDKKSRLRSFFEKEKDLVCIPFYPDDFKNLNFISQNFFREKKIKISQKSINLIIERSNGSREHLKNELQKIALYANNKKEIDFTEVIKLTNLGKNYDISELVETCLVKNQKKVSKIINENNLDINFEELKDYTASMIQKQMMQYGQTPEKEKLDEIISNVMSNKEETRRISEQLMREKILNFYKENAPLNTKKVGFDAFIKQAYGKA